MPSLLTQLHNPPLDTRVINIKIGDVLQQNGSIPLLVTGVREPICGLTALEYECAAGCGTRILPSTQTVRVLRAPGQAAH